ncbi:hypothetical protein MGA3_12395 [Bacillus methanolicus MGA3]|nr:hypothetical protein MGA3_12395 [Bacillus methanolicus MGA3]
MKEAFLIALFSAVRVPRWIRFLGLLRNTLNKWLFLQTIIWTGKEKKVWQPLF